MRRVYILEKNGFGYPLKKTGKNFFWKIGLE